MPGDHNQIISTRSLSPRSNRTICSAVHCNPSTQVLQKFSLLLTSCFHDYSALNYNLKSQFLKKILKNLHVPLSDIIINSVSAQYAAAVPVPKLQNTVLPLPSWTPRFHSCLRTLIVSGVSPRKFHSPTWNILEPTILLIKGIWTRTKTENREKYFTSFPRKKNILLCFLQFTAHHICHDRISK